MLVRPIGQAVKTSPFHGGNSGSIPEWVIVDKLRSLLTKTGCGSVWLERLIWVQEAAGSSPVTPTMWVTSSVGRALDF